MPRRHTHHDTEGQRARRNRRPRPREQILNTHGRFHLRPAARLGNETPSRRQHHLPIERRGRASIAQRVRESELCAPLETDGNHLVRRPRARRHDADDRRRRRDAAAGVPHRDGVAAGLTHLCRSEGVAGGGRTGHIHTVFLPLIREGAHASGHDRQRNGPAGADLL